MRHTSESASQSGYGVPADFGHTGYDPMLQASITEAIQGLEGASAESRQPLPAQAAIEQLAGVRGYDLDLVTVLRRFNPHHVHWKEYEGKYDPGTDLYKWLKTFGLPYFLRAKLPGNRSPQETSQWLYEKYFGHQGIKGDIQVSGEGLLDYHTGVRIDPRPKDPRWPAYAAVRLFPEIDFRIGFDAPQAATPVREAVQSEMYVLLNTSRVVDRTQYRPHLLGYPLNAGRTIQEQIITKGKGYLKRTDTWLKEHGLSEGIEGVVATPVSQRLIQAALLARVPRSSQPTIA